MSTRKLLILTAIFLALLGFVVFFERKQPTTEEREKAKRNLVDFRAEDVASLLLERTDQPRVELVKSGTRWTVAGKPEGPADTVTVDSLVSDLRRLEVEGEVRTSFDPAELGLDSPKVKATVRLGSAMRPGGPGEGASGATAGRPGGPGEGASGAAGRSLTIAFGKEIPGTNATAASEGGRFGAVKYAPMTTLTKPLDDFRSKQLAEVPQNEITRLSIEKGASKVIAVRGPSGDRDRSDIPERSDWFLEFPVKDLANQNFLDQLLSDFMAARVSEFISLSAADLARVGLAPPQAVISLQKGNEVVSTVAFGAAKAETTGKVYARRGDLFFLVDDRLNENLAKEISAFREGKVLSVDPWTLIRVSFERDGVRAGAEKVEGEWRSSGRSLSSALPEELAEKVIRADVRAFVARKDWVAHGILKGKEKTPKALATLEVRKEREQAPRTLTFFAADALNGQPVIAVEVSGRGDLLLIDRAAFDEASQLADRLRAGATPTPAVPSRPATVRPEASPTRPPASASPAPKPKL